MPIVHRHPHTRLIAELSSRFDDLHRLLSLRDLRNAAEGSKDGTPWPEPNKMGATFGSEAEIRLAVDTLKAVLGEVRKVKTPPVPRGDEHIPSATAKAAMGSKIEPGI